MCLARWRCWRGVCWRRRARGAGIRWRETRVMSGSTQRSAGRRTPARVAHGRRVGVASHRACESVART